MNSVKIILKYSGKCFKCGQLILKGNSALLYKGIGLKCIKCIIPFIEDSRLIVINSDEEFYLK